MISKWIDTDQWLRQLVRLLLQTQAVFQGPFQYSMPLLLASFQGEPSTELFRYFHEEVLINAGPPQNYRNNKKVGIIRCESLYRELKQVLHAFHYHFWTKSMPKLNHFRKKSDPDPLASITDLHERQKIINAFRATEMYMFASNVAMGLIMMVSLKRNLTKN